MDTGSVNGLLGSLLSDPGALSAMAALLSQGTGAAPSDAAPASDPTPADGGGNGVGNSAGGGDIGAVLSSLLSDPSVRAAIPGILSALGGGSTPSRPSPPPPPSPGGGGGERDGAPFLPSPPAKRPVRPTDRRSALLLALKPYLSPEKQELVDTLVRIMEIFSLIQNLEGKC